MFNACFIQSVKNQIRMQDNEEKNYLKIHNHPFSHHGNFVGIAVRCVNVYEIDVLSNNNLNDTARRVVC